MLSDKEQKEFEETMKKQNETLQEKEYRELRLGNIYGEERGTGFAGNVWSKEHICPALTTMAGGGRQPMIIQEGLCIREATRKGYAIAEAYDSVNLEQSESKTRRGRVGKRIAQTLATSCNMGVVLPVIAGCRGRNNENPSDRKPGIKLEQRLELNTEGISNTLTTVQKDNYVIVKRDGNASPGTTEKSENTADDGTRVCERYRIRKLTPKECFRLMGYRDEDYDRASEVNSNSQLYKQAGNAIVEGCLMAIFSQLNIRGVKSWNDMTEAERNKLVNRS